MRPALDESFRFLLFETNALDEVKFRLKSLELYDCDELINNKNFRNFVKNHEDTLTSLKIYDIDHISILNLFHRFKSLKKVFLDFVYFKEDDNQILKVFDHIESLEIKNCELSFSKNFPKLKKLKTKHNFHRWSDNKIDDCQYLEHFVIKDDYSDNLRIPSNLKHLEFIHHEFKSPPEFVKPIQLKQLIIKNCINVEWLQKFINEENFQLDLLKLEEVKLPSSFMQTVFDNKHKIKMIQSRKLKFCEEEESNKSESDESDDY